MERNLLGHECVRSIQNVIGCANWHSLNVEEESRLRRRRRWKRKRKLRRMLRRRRRLALPEEVFTSSESMPSLVSSSVE